MLVALAVVATSIAAPVFEGESGARMALDDSLAWCVLKPAELHDRAGCLEFIGEDQPFDAWLAEDEATEVEFSAIVGRGALLADVSFSSAQTSTSKVPLTGSRRRRIVETLAEHTGVIPFADGELTRSRMREDGSEVITAVLDLTSVQSVGFLWSVNARGNSAALGVIGDPSDSEALEALGTQLVGSVLVPERAPLRGLPLLLFALLGGVAWLVMKVFGRLMRGE